MFNKRIKVFAILFSVFLMVTLTVVVGDNELNNYRVKGERVNKIIRVTKTDSEMYLNWPEICSLRRCLLLATKKILNEFINKVKFGKNVYLWKEDNTLCYLDPFDVMGTPDLQSRIYRKEFVPADVKEAISFYQEQMLALTAFFPGFQPWRYLVKVLLLLIISSIPSLLAFLSSLFVLNFPITAPILAACLFFLTMIRGYAQNDTTILKLNTSTTGDRHNLSLAMLHLDNKSGGLVMLSDKGIRGAYGPLWKFSKGMVFFPVGAVCGKGEDGARIEHLSFWRILMLKFGKLNQVFMGSYNQPVVRNLSPYAFAKQV